LDLRPPSGLTPAAFYAALVGAHVPQLGGIGLYQTFVHVDARARTHGHLARWHGGAAQKDDRG